MKWVKSSEQLPTKEYQNEHVAIFLRIGVTKTTGYWCEGSEHKQRGWWSFGWGKVNDDLEWLDETDGWIKVETDLPDYDVDVLWVDEHGYRFCGEIDHDNDFPNFQSWHKDFNGNEVKIIAWMPLPEPPAPPTI